MASDRPSLKGRSAEQIRNMQRGGALSPRQGKRADR